MKRVCWIFVFTLGPALALMAFAPNAASGAEPIKIGALFALSGSAVSLGAPARLVVQMVVDKVNGEGGIDHRPLELVVGDTESDPAKALGEARRLVEKEKVIAVIGPESVDSGMAVKPYIEDTAHIPVIMTMERDAAASGGEHGPCRWTFEIPQRASLAVETVYGALQARSVSRVAVLAVSDGFEADGLERLRRLASKYRMNIVSEEEFSVTDTDMTAQLVKVRDSGAQVLLCQAPGPVAARVAKNLKQLAITIPLVQCNAPPDSKTIELLGEAAEGSLMPATAFAAADRLPDADPRKSVIRAFTELYKDVNHFDRRYPIGAREGYAWDAICILANALRQVGPDPEAVRGAIEQMRGYIGVSGIYNMTPEDHNGLGTGAFVMFKVENGKWVLK